MLSTKDPSIGLVNVTFAGGGQLKQADITKVYKSLKELRSSDLQVEFTGDGFQQVEPPKGIQPQFLGFIAALIILAVVFRTVGAVALPLASAVVALGAGTGRHRLAHPRDERLAGDAAARRPDGHRCRCRLRLVHRHPTSAKSAARHAGRGVDRQLAINTSGPGRAVRGHHRVHRDARVDRVGRQLLLRHGHRCRHRGQLHDGRVADPAAGAAALPRPEGAAAQAAPPAARRAPTCPARGSRSGSAGRSSWPTTSSSSACVSAAVDHRALRSRSSACGWATPTRATTRRTPRPARATT